MARRVRLSAWQYVRAYGNFVLENVLPAFDNLSERADAVVAAEFERRGAQPATEECEGDMSCVAEAAQDEGQAFYNTMVAIRQTSLNLFATGLFHLLEQQLAELCWDGAFEAPPPAKTTLSVVKKWYVHHFKLDLSQLPAWSKVDQLRLVANAVKHGEGDSATKLRTSRPDLFRDPRLGESLPWFEKMYTRLPVRSPLAGESIFVTKAAFTEFCGAASSLVEGVADHFDAHSGEHYLVSGKPVD